MLAALRPLLAFLTIVGATLPCRAQPRILNLDPLLPVMYGDMRVQRVACIGDTCVLVYGMTDVENRQAVETLHWRRIVRGVPDSVHGALPSGARPTSSVAVAAISAGVRLVWADMRADAPGTYAMEITTLGLVATPSHRILPIRLDSMRLFDSPGDQLLIGRAPTGEMVAVRLTQPPLAVAVIDTIPEGSPSGAWRVHAIGDLVAVPAGNVLEFRDIESYELRGSAPATRFLTPFRIERDSSAWVLGDSALEFFERFDAPEPFRSYARPPVTEEIPGALWIVRNADSSIAVATAYGFSPGGPKRSIGVFSHRLLEDGTFAPRTLDTAVPIYNWYPISFNLTWSSMRSIGVSVRGIDYRYTVDYMENLGGPVRRENIDGSFVVLPDGSLSSFSGHASWMPNDAAGQGLPVGLQRDSTRGIEHVRFVSPERSWDGAVRDSVAHVRINTPQWQPSVLAGERGIVIAWTDAPPRERRRGLVARWDEAADTVERVSVVQERYEYSETREGSYRIGMNTHSGAAMLTAIEAENSVGYRRSMGTNTTVSWAALVATSDATFASSNVGYVSIDGDWPVRPSFAPAGGAYFHSSNYDPRRREIVLLASSNGSSFVAMGLDRRGTVAWKLAMAPTSARYIVPVDAEQFLLIANDSIWRAGPTGVDLLPTRLIEPWEPEAFDFVGGRVLRLLDDSFVQIVVDTLGSVRMHLYDLAGNHIRTSSFSVAPGISWYMLAQRPSDSSMAIVWAAGRTLRLSLIDRALTVRTSDTVIAESAGTVEYPACTFIDDDLVVVWEHHDGFVDEIAALRTTIGEIPSVVPPQHLERDPAIPVVRLRSASPGSLVVEVVNEHRRGLRIDVADVRGEIVATSEVHHAVLPGDVILMRDGLPPGFYFVRITWQDQTRVLPRAIVR